jgi:hypothetical protein
LPPCCSRGGGPEHAVAKQRSSHLIKALIHQALDGKGYDPKLVDLACRQVRE